MLDRCPTKDRMAAWGLDVDRSCILCNAASESRDHLFFNCPYTWDIWESFMSRSPIPPPPLPNWHDVLSAMRATTPLGPWRLLTLLTWQATIYFCWSERNSRLHRSAFRHRDLIKKDIDRVIRQKIAATRYSNPNLSSSLFQAWTV